MEKLFTKDKNYFLKKAQKDSQQGLLKQLIFELKNYYQCHFNPLRLNDPIMEILSGCDADISRLNDLYFKIAVTYRYNYSDNQLELLFDGGSQYEKYLKDWKLFFINEIKALLQMKRFTLLTLDLLYFNGATIFNKRKMNSILEEKYGLRILRNKKIIKLDAA